jgi:hypothetical protein
MGWSRCSFVLKASFISGVALGPSITLAGSPGTACIIINMVATAHAIIKSANKILWIVYLIKWLSRIIHARDTKKIV